MKNISYGYACILNNTHTHKLFLNSKLYKLCSVLQMGVSYYFLKILVNGCDF